MEILQFLIDNGTPLLAVVGGVTGALGITVPFLKPSATKQVGRAIGKIAKVVFRQKRRLEFRRLASTAEQLCEGILEELK